MVNSNEQTSSNEMDLDENGSSNSQNKKKPAKEFNENDEISEDEKQRILEGIDDSDEDSSNSG